MKEKINGVSKPKQQLNELLSKISSDDILVVTRVDRLDRNTVQLLQLVEQFPLIPRIVSQPLKDI